MFTAYVSARDHAFVDRALYLPKSWTSNPARLVAAHVPEGKTIATKPAPAVQMIERAIIADMPFARVAVDAVYGVGDIEQVLRRAGKGYVLGVKSDHRFGSWGDKPVVVGTALQIADDLNPAAPREQSSRIGLFITPEGWVQTGYRSNRGTTVSQSGSPPPRE